MNKFIGNKLSRPDTLAGTGMLASPAFAGGTTLKSSGEFIPREQADGINHWGMNAPRKH